MVPSVKPEEFWFRIRMVLRSRDLSLLWLAKTLGRRVRFIQNRSDANRVTKKESEEILDALDLTMNDMALPIEVFANKIIGGRSV